MSTDADLDGLLAGFLHGELTPAEDQDLAARLEDDPALRERLRALLCIDDLLRQGWAAERAPAAFLTALDRRLQQAGLVPSTTAVPLASASRVVRRVLARRHPAGVRRWLPLAGGLLAASVVVVVGLVLVVSGGGAERIATLSMATPGATIAGVQVMRDGELTVVASGMAVHSGDRIAVAAEPAGISYPDGSQITVLVGTQLRLWDEAGGKRIQLDHGELVCAVAPQPSDRSMKLLTAEAEAEVVGTRFRLRAGPGLARLDVAEGAVSFRRRDGSASIVHGGETASATATPPPPEILLNLDFEDDAQAAFCQEGQISPEPQRAGSRYVLVGSQRDPQAGGKVRLGVDAGQRLFTYAGDLELSFDYWVDDQARSIDVWCWDDSQEATFGSGSDAGSHAGQATLRDLRPKTWTSVTLRLDAWRSNTGGSMRPGDLIRHLSIQVGQRAAVLSIDNLQIRRIRTR